MRKAYFMLFILSLSLPLTSQDVQASENYYLLYSSPKNYKEDGKFKRIEVRVKGEKYKVVHRFGYFAN